MDIFDTITLDDEKPLDLSENDSGEVDSIKSTLSKIEKQLSDKEEKRQQFNKRLTDQIKALIQAEVAKVQIKQEVIEKVIETRIEPKPIHIAPRIIEAPPAPPAPPQIIREIRVEVPVEKKDTTKYAELSAFQDLLVKISKLEHQLRETRRMAESPIVMGGSGVIGIPPPEPSTVGYVLTVNQNKKAEWQESTGGGGLQVEGTPTINQTIIFDGTNPVWADQGTTFDFLIDTFTDGFAASIEIGNGVWKAIGELNFQATYLRGPATSGAVTKSGWSSPLDLTNDFQGPTPNAEAVNYPSVGGTVVFSLNAAGAAGSDSASITHTFNNRRFWGVSNKSSGFTESDIEGFASNELSNSKAKSFTVIPGSGEYIVFAYPKRLGTATFTIGGFEGGFNPPETVSVTNDSGYTEEYYVYSSVQPNLGSSNVVSQ